MIDTVKSAVLSADGVYRYELRRSWASSLFERDRRVLWIMLNPSTADGDRDDATLSTITRFSHGWGYSGLAVANLFAFRSRWPSDLLDAADPVGPLNDATLARLACSAEHELVVAAWGARGGLLNRDRVVLDLLAASRVDVHHVGLTASGRPRHPLYLPSATVPTPLELP